MIENLSLVILFKSCVQMFKSSVAISQKKIKHLEMEIFYSQISVIMNREFFFPGNFIQKLKKKINLILILNFCNLLWGLMLSLVKILSKNCVQILKFSVAILQKNLNFEIFALSLYNYW